MRRALAGALGFLSRLPVGRDEASLAAFRRTPAAFPLAGYVLGAILAVPFFFGFPAPTLAFAYVLLVVTVTGVNHADGLADLGDAAVVHGDPEKRRSVMRDTTVGVGAVLAVGGGQVGLATGAAALAGLPGRVAVGTVVAAEVGAKLGVATVVCRGAASHEGFGAAFTERAAPDDLLLPVLAALPAVALAGDATAGVAALLAGVGVAFAVNHWARRRLGGVGGDVMGATNELARVAAIHAGVIAWTLL